MFAVIYERAPLARMSPAELVQAFYAQSERVSDLE